MEKKQMKRLLTFLLMASILMCGCGTTSGIYEPRDNQGNEDSSKPEEDETQDTQNEETEKIETEKVYLEGVDIENAYSDPDSYEGKYITISGQVFGEPENDGEYIYFQMFADPRKSEKSTIVAFSGSDYSIESEDYVIVDGEIRGAVEYENAFGGTLSALTIMADNVQKSSYAEAVDPAEKTIDVNMTIEQYGYAVTVEKVEFTSSETRVYVRVTNNGSDKFNFYDFNTKILQNGSQYEIEYNYLANYPEVQSDLLQGAETSGIVIFPAIDQNSAFQIYNEASSDNWDEDFDPFVFDITP